MCKQKMIKPQEEILSMHLRFAWQLEPHAAKPDKNNAGHMSDTMNCWEKT